MRQPGFLVIMAGEWICCIWLLMPTDQAVAHDALRLSTYQLALITGQIFVARAEHASFLCHVCADKYREMTQDRAISLYRLSALMTYSWIVSKWLNAKTQSSNELSIWNLF